jgi:hypothetical protein
MYSKPYNWAGSNMMIIPKKQENDQLVADWDSHLNTHEFQLVSDSFFRRKQVAVVSVGRVGVGQGDQIKRS